MKVHPSELSTLGYKVDVEISHKELIPFIKSAHKLKTRSTLIYQVSNGILIGLALYTGIHYAWSDTLKFDTFFTHLGFGAAIAFLLIPLHEYLHVLAYKYVGARNTSYAANLKKFYFMALADQFVASRKEFRIVALTPFVVITCCCLILMPFLSYDWMITVLGILTLHTAFCSGDFGLMAYTEHHQDKEPVTYDDVTTGTSYFLLKEDQSL